MPCGGGDDVDHSRVLACQGLSPAGLPRKRLQKKLMMKRTCVAPRQNAATLIIRFRGPTCARCAYCV